MCPRSSKKRSPRSWRKRRRKSVYKPGFVRRPDGRRDDHFSRKSIARSLQRPTRESMAGRTDPLGGTGGDAASPAHAPCLTLLPVGFTEPGRSPGLLVSSYLTVSPLPRGPKPARRFTFCCTFPGLAAGGRYPSLRPTEPGLSSRRVLLGATRGSSLQTRPAIIRPTPDEIKHRLSGGRPGRGVALGVPRSPRETRMAGLVLTRHPPYLRRRREVESRCESPDQFAG